MSDTQSTHEKQVDEIKEKWNKFTGWLNNQKEKQLSDEKKAERKAKLQEIEIQVTEKINLIGNKSKELSNELYEKLKTDLEDIRDSINKSKDEEKTV